MAGTSHAIGLIFFLLYAWRKKWYGVARSPVRRLYVRVQSLLMAEQDWDTNEKNAGESPRAAKKLYQDPAFRHEKVFETMALHCGKIQATSLMCHQMRSSS